MFERQTYIPTDTLQHSVGAPRANTGLSATAFRPSDDATTFPFNLASNAMACVELQRLSTLSPDQSIAKQASSLAAEICQSVNQIWNSSFQQQTPFPFEIDGFGGQLLMDDANIPSLLSLPYLGFCDANDPNYLRIRHFILSSSNPYYFSGKYAAGVGSPHTDQNSIWPLALIMQARTSTDQKEILSILDILKSTTAGTNFMHESFNVNDPTAFTRAWFAWANTQFADLILHIRDTNPSLIFNNE